MRRTLALLLAATVGLGAPAQAAGRVVAAPAVLPSGGLGTPVVSRLPTLSANLPISAAALPKPVVSSVLPAVSALVPVVAPAVSAVVPAVTPAVTARQALQATQAAVAQSPAAPKTAEGGWTAGRSAFDAGISASPSAPAVAVPGGGVSRSGLARPSAFANQVSGRAAPEAPRSGAKVRAIEFVETAMYGGGVALLSFVIASALGATFPLLVGPAMGLTSHVASHAMFDQLGGLRGRVVDGWQASHDQRYRVGGDGQLRDVRGHKYGADRYERYAPGPVGRTASILIRSAAVAAGAVWLSGVGLTGWALYAAVFAGLEILAARQRAKAARDSGPVSEEGRAHADRFGK